MASGRVKLTPEKKRMKRKIIIIGLSIFLTGFCRAQETERVWTLGECMEYAVRHSSKARTQGYTVMQGEIIYDGVTEEEATKSFDNEKLTYCSAPKQPFWIGLDLGEKNKKHLSYIEFCPWNDMNMIEKGDDYELFYYNYGWHSLGRRIADADSLLYHNVPENALFWLRNHTKGKEERIFTYENGRQIWW